MDDEKCYKNSNIQKKRFPNIKHHWKIMKIKITIAEYLWIGRPNTYSICFGKFSLEQNGIGYVLIVFENSKNIDRIITKCETVEKFGRNHFKLFNLMADI